MHIMAHRWRYIVGSEVISRNDFLEIHFGNTYQWRPVSPRVLIANSAKFCPTSCRRCCILKLSIMKSRQMLLLENVSYRNKSKRLVLPIFYHVDPSDVRKQSGWISEALCYHEEKFKSEVDETKRKNLMDKIKEWRIALTQLANLGGMPLQNVANGYESKLIQKIVNVVKDKVTCNTASTTHPVGIGPSVQDISLWLRNGSSDVEVLICTLWCWRTGEDNHCQIRLRHELPTI
ncbi:hypothetical protein POM88_027969 [Heracleum sosnowskyi]|uniref:TIR domain-containing protein n=1 Tax=Heracleum sosnowskyi TaxID=360622 RepID=A0AAD8MLY6_9APIA|nr:hypothetical protein POM88_027969 [Heracleum sosnowskyi]